MKIEIDDQASLRRSLWRELILLRAGWTCDHCRKEGSSRTLDAHHVNGDNKDHRLANGACLCDSCHCITTMTGRKRVMSDEWHEKMRNQDRSGRMTEAVKAKIGAKAKERCANPEFRAGMSARTKANWEDPEFRKRASEGIRRAWAERKAAA